MSSLNRRLTLQQNIARMQKELDSLIKTQQKYKAKQAAQCRLWKKARIIGGGKVTMGSLFQATYIDNVRALAGCKSRLMR